MLVGVTGVCGKTLVWPGVLAGLSDEGGYWP